MDLKMEESDGKTHNDQQHRLLLLFSYLRCDAIMSWEIDDPLGGDEVRGGKVADDTAFWLCVCVSIFKCEYEFKKNHRVSISRKAFRKIYSLQLISSVTSLSVGGATTVHAIVIFSSFQTAAAVVIVVIIVAGVVIRDGRCVRVHERVRMRVCAKKNAKT